jgi:hypothetical protein
MVEAGIGKNAGRYIIETRMDELIKELNIDQNRITGVSHKSAAWNVKNDGRDRAPVLSASLRISI